ncbi:MAG: Na+/H+ antiporter NhaC family protein [Deltaproteobacteria bacterium]|nr:MAG: Na+/H+ antiporter NhaC family protein [Deltaproteobacteria bacterium]
MANSSSSSRLWLFALPGFLLLCLLPWLPVDQGYLRDQAQGHALHQATKSWETIYHSQQAWHRWVQWAGWEPQEVLSLFHHTNAPNHPYHLSTLAAPYNIGFRCHPSPCNPSLKKKLSRLPLPGMKVAKEQATTSKAKVSYTWTVHLTATQDSRHKLQLTLMAVNPSKPQEATALWSGKGSSRTIQWVTLLPPLAAILLVLLTRRILFSLFFCVLLGAWILNDWNLWLGFYHTGATYLWERSIRQEFSVYIILFVLCLIGMINVTTRNGGIAGLMERLSKYARTPRSSRFVTAALGLVIFFDDYANTITVGNTMRPLTDRYRVSREKLAYLIDSTAAPIAGLAIVSTWIGYEAGLLQKIADDLSLSSSGYLLFWQSLPFRFYCWMTLLFVFVGILWNRDYGPMWEAERRATEDNKLVRDGARPMLDVQMEHLHPSDEIPHRGRNALLPILVVLLSIMGGLLYSGGFFEGHTLTQALTEANSAKVFFWSSVAGSVVAILLSVLQGLLSLRDALYTWLLGARALWMAAGILILAWAMAASSSDLGSAHFLIAMLQRGLPPLWLPLLIFLMSACVAFATGSSWGTMGILLPTTAPLAYAMGGAPLLLLSLGAVLDGSIFGDHCSPLSDTTLFSSAAAACDHVDHVKTQAPYALTVMAVAGSTGYLAVAAGMSPWFTPPLALFCFAVVFYRWGRPLPPLPKT